MSVARRLTLVALVLVVLTVSAHAQDAKVTVVAILANGSNQPTDPKLKELANEVKKHEPGLTSYKIERTTVKPLSVGQKESFALVNDVTADVTVVSKDDGKQRVGLKVKPPTVGEISYVINYNKFLPIITRHVSANERLIIAVMVQPPAK